MKNLLVLIDVDESARLLIDRALELATTFGAACWLLHVADPEPDFIGYAPGPPSIRDERARNLREAHKVLEACREPLLDRQVPCEILLVPGHPAQVIQEEIRRRRIDLIILGHHRKIRMKDWIAGSVGKDVLHLSTVPMLIIPITPDS